MRKKLDREQFLGPKGSELRKFMERPGCYYPGSDGIDEETARKLNEHIDKAHRGELKGGFPKEVLEREKRLKFPRKRKSFNRDKFLGPPGSELRKLMMRPGRLELGPEGIDEETAKKLNELFEKVERGEVPEGIPQHVLEREKQLRFC
ncbi:MAG: hypothetical protein WC460_05745 [Patescibacteria group bacterium]